MIEVSSFHTARLIIKSTWGHVDPPGYARNILAAKEWRAARMEQAVTNLKRLRGLDYDAKGHELSGGGNKDTAALCFDYKNEFPASLNALPGGATAGFVAVPKPFASDTPGLVFTDGTPGVVATLPGPTLTENQHFSIQFYLHKPPAEELRALGQRALWQLRWGANAGVGSGSGVASYWQFQIADGHAEIMRLLPAWTQAQEDTLNGLLALEDPTNEQTDAAAALTNTIYADVNRVSVGKGSLYNQDIELAFLAESRGIIDVAESDRDIDAIEIPSILKKRRADIIWPASQLILRSNIGIFAHQWGKPAFKKSGSIRLGTYISDADFASGDATFGGLWDAPDGTSVAVINESGDSGDDNYNAALKAGERETVIKLTGDGTKTPFVYSAYVYQEAGERTGSDTVIWDSDEHPNCIREIDPQLEGGSQGPVARRCRYNVTIRAFNEDRDKAAFGTGANLLADAYRFENHVCDLYINDVKRVGNGIVLGSSFTNARSGEMSESSGANIFAQDMLWPWTDLELDISDKWPLVDEAVFEGDEPLGDGQTTGKHLRSCLRGVGERWDEIGFEDTDGSIIEPASLGEKFAALPDTFEERGVYMTGVLRDHSETHQQIDLDPDGIWQLIDYERARRLDQEGNAVSFESGIRNNSNNIPGRYAILKKFEMTRDFSKVYNYFTGIGAEDEKKRPIHRTWTEWPSIEIGTRWPKLSVLGRKRPMNPVRNSGWRTALPVERAVRRLAVENCRSGWFFAFETYFHAGLYPGDRIYVEGWDAEIVRVSGGSWARDRMMMVVLILGE